MLDLKMGKKASLIEYTPFPFWFWNDLLSKKEIKRQIEDFHQKGVDGFIIHPRMGLPKSIEYMGEVYLDFVEYAVECAQGLNMKVILYDEAMYPSGSAHGKVVKTNSKFASRGLGFVDEEYYRKHHKEDGFEVLEKYFKKNDNYFERQEETPENQNDFFYLISEYSQGTIRGVHEGEDDGQPDAPRSSDLLDPEVTALFIAKTHEVYYQRLKAFFGETIVGFFTDEPEILGRKRKKGLYPWSNWMLAYYQKEHIPLKKLISLFIETSSEKVDIAQYQKILHQLLNTNYYQPLAEWCGKHDIFLTGHPAKSDDIGYLRTFQVPGQDLVWRWISPENNLKSRHSMVGKCSADSARHSGARRNSNEVFGCCGPNGEQWALSPEDLKWYLDWLFSRGVNLIVPHAFFYSLRTRLQEDRLPDVGPNNVWWDEFNYFSNYIKYMSWVMTASVNQAQIAILTGDTQMPFQKMKVLFENQLEFNYLESYYLESNKFELDEGHIKVNKQDYHVILLENEKKFSHETREKLDEIQKYGIEIIDISMLSENELLNIIKKKIAKPFISRNPAVRYSLLEKDQSSFVLISNEGEEEETIDLKMGDANQIYRIFDPWQNEILTKSSDSNAALKIDLGYRQLVMIEKLGSDGEKDAVLSQITVNSEEEFQYEITTNNPVIDSLGDWCSFPDKTEFSGKIDYAFQIDIKNFIKGNKYYLNLGNVKNMATLKINGKIIETKFWKPYKFEVTDYLSNDGKLECSFEVKNLLANSKNHLALPSGLLGPVTLTKREEKNENKY